MKNLAALFLTFWMLPTLGTSFVVMPQTVSHSSALWAAGEKFEITIDMPPSDSGRKANLNIDSVLPEPAEIVVVRYKVPFGLNVEPKKGLAVCTADGPGGEKVGDVLRYTTRWSLGLPQGESLAGTAAAFAGGLSWQCSVFDVLKAKAWEQLVEALVSNTQERTDEVVLVFERSIQ